MIFAGELAKGGKREGGSGNECDGHHDNKRNNRMDNQHQTIVFTDDLVFLKAERDAITRQRRGRKARQGAVVLINEGQRMNS